MIEIIKHVCQTLTTIFLFLIIMNCLFKQTLQYNKDMKIDKIHLFISLFIVAVSIILCKLL